MAIARRTFVAAALATIGTCAARAAVTDATGRDLRIPGKVVRVFPAGPPAAILLYTLAPNLLLGWPRANRPEECAYMLPDICARPEVGRITGRGNTANLESVLALKPDLILDVGSTSPTFVSLAERVQQQTGIPYALLDGRFDAIPASYRKLGELVSRQDEAEKYARYAADTLKTIIGQAAAITPSNRPRGVLAAVLVGAALAVAGTAFQGLFRNPLVSPDILGASSGAALGAVIGIFFSLGVIAIQILAFAGGLLAVAAVYLIGSAVRARDPILVLVLTGVVVGALLGAGVGLVKYLADPYNQLPAMTFWLLGSLAAANVTDLLPLFGPVAIGSAVLIALRWRMNVMSLPEEEARSLGIATGPLRIAIVAAATLTTSASVATAGIIGWVGLVVPHLARSLVGPDFARLLPTAAILGGGYLLLIDTLARTAAEVEIPLGILTAVVGTPFFIWLLASMQKTWS